MLHFFLAAAFAELALVGVSGEQASTNADPQEQVLRHVSRLRDLFKFEFFFPDRAAFEAEVLDEIAQTDPDWEARLRADPEARGRRGRRAIREWFEARRPLVAHGTLRPFIEGYGIGAEELLRREADQSLADADFLGACMGLASQRVLQGRISSHDSASRETLKNCLQLVQNRALLAPEASAGRQELFDLTREVTRQVEAIHRTTVTRHGDPFT